MEGRDGREGPGRPDGGDDRFEDDDWIERSVSAAPAGAVENTAAQAEAADDGTATDDVADYAAAVRAELGDLSADAVADLLEDLEDHLREVAAEDTGDLRERLGTPAAYAAELRASAGLPERGPASSSAGSAGPGRRRRSAADRLAALERRLRTQWLGREILDFLPLLRPAWWIVRAWLLVVLLQMLTVNDDRGQIGFIPRPGDSQLLGMLLLVLAVAASIWLTRRPPLRGRRGRLFMAAQSLLGVFAVVVFLHGVSDNAYYAGGGPVYVGNGYPGDGGLSENGTPITNLYVYDKDGKLLTGVYVYDQSGNPVHAAEVGGDEVTQSFVDVNDTFVFNRYPQLVSRIVYGNDGSQHLVPVNPPVVQPPSGVRPADGQGLPLAPTTAPTTAASSTPADTPGTPSASGSPTPTPTSSAATSPTPSATPSGSRS